MYFNKKLFFGSLNNKGKITISILYIEPILRSFLSKNFNFKIIIINPGKTPNNFLYKKYSEKIALIGEESPFLRILLLFIFKFFIEGSFKDLNLQEGNRKKYFLKSWQKLEPSISFNNKEKLKEDEILNLYNLKKKNYVCFALRDSAYYKSFTNRDAAPDTFFKNPSLDNYENLIKISKKKNLKLVRMGSVVSSKSRILKDNDFIDYPFTKYKSDFADFVLLKNAKFVISGACGIFCIASAFNVPTIHTDAYLLWGTLRSEDLFIPQLYFDSFKKKYLTFYEMIVYGESFQYEKFCKKKNIKFVKNTTEDLEQVFDEMNSNINKEYIYNKEDNELQKKFKDIYKQKKNIQSNSFFYSIDYLPGRIGKCFLNKNKNLL
jgi:putative glycosyltransferase (TIGR04372 family)